MRPILQLATIWSEPLGSRVSLETEEGVGLSP